MISKSLKNVGGNSAGMKGKLKSFEDILLSRTWNPHLLESEMTRLRKWLFK